ncbi:hypothetical protein AAG570_005736 [Ranatra chinensis]|uniref:Uncharacterized protein n=1 Tax=Ranatra chinensis TaxID=642074 RepID=A0ABD0XYC3_9HEMI
MEGLVTVGHTLRVLSVVLMISRLYGRKSSCKGLSWKTQVLFSIVFVCDAILSMPRSVSDFIEDPFNPLYSFILIMGQLIVLVLFVCRANTYDATEDNSPLTSGPLGVLLNFRVLLDCIAILPQVFMLSKIRRVQLGFFTRYFLLLVGYKLCLVVAMVLAYVFRGLCTSSVRSNSSRHRPYSLGSIVPVNVDCKRSADFNSPPLNPSSPFDYLPPGVTRGCTQPSVYKPKYVRGLGTEMHNINKEQLKESHLREKVPVYEEIAEDFIPERMEDGRLDSKEGKEPSFCTFDEGHVYNVSGCPGYMGDEAIYDKHRGFMNTLVCVGTNFADCANYPIMTPHAERFPPVDFPTFSHGTFDCGPAMGSNCPPLWRSRPRGLSSTTLFCRSHYIKMEVLVTFGHILRVLSVGLMNNRLGRRKSSCKGDLREKVSVYEEIKGYFIPEEMKYGKLDSKEFYDGLNFLFLVSKLQAKRRNNEDKEPSFCTRNKGRVYNIFGCPRYKSDEAIHNKRSGSMITFLYDGTNVLY